jgi:hypothetical protein
MAVCCSPCTVLPLHQRTRTNVKNFIDEQYDKHKEFLEEKFWKERLLPAFQSFTQQSVQSDQQGETASASIADAQIANAAAARTAKGQAKDIRTYQGDQATCQMAAGARATAAAQAVGSEVTREVAAASMTRRLGRSEGGGGGGGGGGSDARDPRDVDLSARRDDFNTNFCSPTAWGGAFKDSCPSAGPLADRDIDWNKLQEKWTLDLRPDYATQSRDSWTDDEKIVEAMRQHLFGHQLPSSPSSESLKKYNVQVGYLNQRALEAKRNVAETSFNSFIGERTAADEGAKEWLDATLEQLGITLDAATQAKIGEKPSYYAIMEVLTKKMLQDPNFYTGLIKPGPQVAQTQASLQAVNLMQQRDVYESLLRSELILSLIVEMELAEQQGVVQSQTDQ